MAKICRFRGCDRVVVAKKLCRSHYDQHRRGKRLHPLDRPISQEICSKEDCTRRAFHDGLCLKCFNAQASPICSVPGCPLQTWTRGMCRVHSERWYRGADMDAPFQAPRGPQAKPRGTCEVEGCERPVKCRNLCKRHYYHLRKHGRVFKIGPYTHRKEKAA